MQKQSRIQVLINTKTKKRAQKVIEKRGLTLSDAVRMFMQNLAQEKISIEITPIEKNRKKINFIGFPLDIPNNLNRNSYYD